MISKTQLAISATIFLVAVYSIHAVGGIDTIVRRLISTFTDL
jgi:hypothetical protein